LGLELFQEHGIELAQGKVPEFFLQLLDEESFASEGPLPFRPFQICLGQFIEEVILDAFDFRLFAFLDRLFPSDQQGFRIPESA